MIKKGKNIKLYIEDILESIGKIEEYIDKVKKGDSKNRSDLKRLNYSLTVKVDH